MQFNALAIFAAVAGLVAAAPAPTTETFTLSNDAVTQAIDAAVARLGATPEATVEKRSCGYESWGVCVAVESVACTWACGGQYKCLPSCPQIAYQQCAIYGC